MSRRAAGTQPSSSGPGVHKATNSIQSSVQTPGGWWLVCGLGFPWYLEFFFHHPQMVHPHHPLFIQQTSSTLHPQSIGRRGTWSDLRQARYFKSGRTLSMHTVGLLFWIVLNPWGPFWEGRPVRLGEYWTVCGEEMAEVKAEHCWTRSSPAGTDWRVGNRVRLKTGQPKS